MILLISVGRDWCRGLLDGSGRSTALRVHEALKARPLAKLWEAARRAGLTFPTASKGMSLLAGLGIARELTGKRQNRVFVYDRYVEMLAEGTGAVGSAA